MNENGQEVGREIAQVYVFVQRNVSWPVWIVAYSLASCVCVTCSCAARLYIVSSVVVQFRTQVVADRFGYR